MGGCYIPPMLIDRPEVSQHWSPRVAGRGQVLMRKWWPSEGIMPMRTPHPELLLPVSLPHSEPWILPTSTGDPSAPAGRSGLGSYEVTAYFPRSWCTQDLVYSLQEWSFCCPQSCGIARIKHHWLAKPGSLGASPPVARSPGWGTSQWGSEFHCGGKTSVV